MTYAERILKFFESKMHAWDDDVTNNHRFIDGEEAATILKAILESNEKLVEKIRMSISRSDDYGDSHCSQPIRQALKDHAADMEKILEGPP
jgi:hypothetical protein